jgi:hypothetical protein
MFTILAILPEANVPSYFHQTLECSISSRTLAEVAQILSQLDRLHVPEVTNRIIQGGGNVTLYTLWYCIIKEIANKQINALKKHIYMPCIKENT